MLHVQHLNVPSLIFGSALIGTNTATFYFDPPETVGLIDGIYSAFGADQGDILTLTMQPSVETVPVPVAVWLMGSGLIGLIGVARRKA